MRCSGAGLDDTRGPGGEPPPRLDRAQRTARGAVSVLASVTGVADGRNFKRAHTAGLVVQRPVAIAAIVTGGDAGRAPMASSRAHTMGFVVQRVFCAVARPVAAWRGGGALARWASWAFKRAHTMGLLVHDAAAELSDGADQIRPASRAGTATRASRVALPRAGAGPPRAAFPASILESSNDLSLMLITSSGKCSSSGRDFRMRCVESARYGQVYPARGGAITQGRLERANPHG